MTTTKLVTLAVVSIFATGMAAGVAGADPQLERGRKLYGLCTQCHGEQGLGDQRFLAPAIAGLELWYVQRELEYFRSGVRGTHFDDIAGMRMRPMALTLRSQEDVAAVAAYVASMPPTKPPSTLSGGNAAKGQVFYDQVCKTCHGPDGAGIQAQNGPDINHGSDWYQKKQIENFKAGVRGANPKDVTGMLMRPMAMTLVDEQAILDVIAYINTLSPTAAQQAK
ncbi:MAG: c-type cytochrome [Deltaproteobacteria bacterium]|nr:c-type cytochrome [Deltaproteobacteria bacterium]MBW2418634.1 c-type cytochrome [Deltaproteobacteria bacterium]